MLAAGRPGAFTVADSRALATLRGLRLMPPGPAVFRLSDWLPYLSACRALARQCGLTPAPGGPGTVDRRRRPGLAGHQLSEEDVWEKPPPGADAGGDRRRCRRGGCGLALA